MAASSTTNIPKPAWHDANMGPFQVYVYAYVFVGEELGATKLGLARPPHGQQRRLQRAGDPAQSVEYHKEARP